MVFINKNKTFKVYYYRMDNVVKRKKKVKDGGKTDPVMLLITVNYSDVSFPRVTCRYDVGDLQNNIQSILFRYARFIWFISLFLNGQMQLQTNHVEFQLYPIISYIDIDLTLKMYIKFKNNKCFNFLKNKFC